MFTAKGPILLNGQSFAAGDTIDPSKFKPKKSDDPAEYSAALDAALEQLEQLGRVEKVPAKKGAAASATAAS